MQGILVPLCSYLRYQVFEGTEKRGKGTMGWLYRDKGYISDPLEQELADKGVILITGVKRI